MRKKGAIYFFTTLRILVGWHFLYEGIAKMNAPNWRTKVYLANSQWIFLDVFQAMDSSPEIFKVIDFFPEKMV